MASPPSWAAPTMAVEAGPASPARLRHRDLSFRPCSCESLTARKDEPTIHGPRPFCASRKPLPIRLSGFGPTVGPK